jgi:hypothetical protein
MPGLIAISTPENPYPGFSHFSIEKIPEYTKARAQTKCVVQDYSP